VRCRWWPRRGSWHSGGGASLSQTVTIPITVNAVNDAPVVTVPSPRPVGRYALDEGLGRSLMISGVGVTDVDAGATLPAILS